MSLQDLSVIPLLNPSYSSLCTLTSTLVDFHPSLRPSMGRFLAHVEIGAAGRTGCYPIRVMFVGGDPLSTDVSITIVRARGGGVEQQLAHYQYHHQPVSQEAGLHHISCSQNRIPMYMISNQVTCLPQPFALNLITADDEIGGEVKKLTNRLINYIMHKYGKHREDHPSTWSRLHNDQVITGYCPVAGSEEDRLSSYESSLRVDKKENL